MGEGDSWLVARPRGGGGAESLKLLFSPLDSLIRGAQTEIFFFRSGQVPYARMRDTQEKGNLHG